MSSDHYIKRRFGIVEENSITDYNTVPQTENPNPFATSSQIDRLSHKPCFRNLYNMSFIIYYIHAFISIEFRQEITAAFIYFMFIETSCLAIMLFKISLNILMFRQKSISLWRFFEMIGILLAWILLLFELTGSFTDNDVIFKIISVLRFWPLITQIKFLKIRKRKKRFSVIPFKTNSERLIMILRNFKDFRWVKNDKDLIREIEWGIDCICSQTLYNIEVQTENKEQEEAIMWAMSERPRWNMSKLLQKNLISDPTDLNFSIPVEDCLKKVDKLSFNVFKLKNLTNNNELVVITSHLFYVYDLCSTEKLVKSKFNNFIKSVQGGYRAELPYHNSTHAADVVQAFNYYLIGCGVKELYNFSITEYTICILSGSIHDYQHPGRTNAFLVNSKHDLALLYNDMAVLENHHVASCFKLMQNSECNFLEDLSLEVSRKYRSLMIELVLATDFSRHFKDLAKFKLRFNKETGIENETHKSSMLKMLMHAADVSNSTRKWDIYYEWAQRVLNEFFSQGDEEKEKGLSISPLCDRHTVNFAKSQTGFIDMFIMPVFAFLAEINGNFFKSKRNVERNRSLLVSMKEKEPEEDKILTS